MSFMDKLRRFMQDRNGMDKLNFFLIIAYLLMNGIGYMFLRSWRYRYILSSVPYNSISVTGIIGMVLRTIGFALLIYAIFRFFSRNLYKRSYEEDRFLELIARIRRKEHKHRSDRDVSAYREVKYKPEHKSGEFKKRIKLRWKYRKTHRFRTCPGCSEFLRLSKKRGKRNITCPKCGKQFTVHITL